MKKRNEINVHETENSHAVFRQSVCDHTGMTADAFISMHVLDQLENAAGALRRAIALRSSDQPYTKEKLALIKRSYILADELKNCIYQYILANDLNLSTIVRCTAEEIEKTPDLTIDAYREEYEKQY